MLQLLLVVLMLLLCACDVERLPGPEMPIFQNEWAKWRMGSYVSCALSRVRRLLLLLQAGDVEQNPGPAMTIKQIKQMHLKELEQACQVYEGGEEFITDSQIITGLSTAAKEERLRQWRTKTSQICRSGSEEGLGSGCIWFVLCFPSRIMQVKRQSLL